VKRFDRVPQGPVHIEDFAQVFRVFREDKYKKASYRNIAEVIAAEAGNDGVAEFVRRLVFNTLIGNANMHLKNWSLIYPDGRAVPGRRFRVDGSLHSGGQGRPELRADETDGGVFARPSGEPRSQGPPS
jgi:hypothetical protein